MPRARRNDSPDTAPVKEAANIRWATRAGLVLSKLAPPDLRGPLAWRERLFGPGGGLPDTRVTVIEGPAGYGKTTALAQWCESARNQGVATGWVSFDEFDRTPESLLSSLASACDLALGRRLGATLDGADPGSADSILMQIGELLASTRRRTVIFLDDLHLVGLSVVVAAIATLVERSDPAVSFVIGGRPPVLTAFRSSALAPVLQVRGSDVLRFSPDEARAVIRNALPDALIGDLVARLQGWPAMIRLISGAGATGLSSPWAKQIGDLGANDAYDYLMEEIYRRLEPVQRRILESAARMVRITGGVLDFVLGRSDGEAQLRGLQEACVLIDSVERPGLRIYRLHDLLRDFVLRHLPSHAAGSIELERKLSRYYESQNDLPMALYHALEARDEQLVDRLIQSGGWHTGLEIGPSMLSRMRSGAGAPSDAQPQTQRAIIYSLLQSGRVREARRRLLTFGAAETAFDRSEHAVLELLIEHYEDVPLKTSRIDDLHTTHSRRDGASWQAVALLNTNMRAYSHYDAGRYGLCLELSTAAARACEERGLAYARNYALFFCGLCHLALANFDEAAGCWREAEDCAVFGLHRLDLHRHQTMIRIFSAQSRWEAGGPPLSVQELDSLEAALQDRFDGWPVVFGAFFSVAPEMRACVSGLAEGLAILERGLAVAHENDWKRVSLQLRARAVLLCLQHGQSDMARERLVALRHHFDAQDTAGPRDEYAPDCRAEELVWIAQAWLALAEGDVSRGLAEAEGTVHRLQSRGSILNLRLATLLHELARAAEARGRAHSDSPNAAGPRSVARLSKLAAALGITVGRSDPNSPQGPAPAGALRSALTRLSPRERTIVELIASGYCVKEISKSLHLSAQTVAYYRKASYGKLGVSKRSEVCQLLHANNPGSGHGVRTGRVQN